MDGNSEPYYPSPLPQDSVEAGLLILRDGSTAELRPARAEDRERIEGFLEHLSEASRIHRFFGDVSADIGADQLLKLAPSEQEEALIVLAGEGEHARVIAHGMYVRDEPASEAAEVAFIVDDSYQDRGLGTLLLERLALIAARHGIRRFHGPTEARNRPMLGLFHRSGFPIREDRDGNYVEVSFSIQPNRESVERFEMREQIATVASLGPFFKPRSVAIIGASREPDSIGFRILEYLVRDRFNGPVYPVNRSAEVVGSIPAYRSVHDVPGPISLAIITVPRQAVAAVIDDCGKKGVRALIVISAGFAETGEEGRALQDELVAKAHGYGMRLIGPNCLGLLNTAPTVRLNGSFSPVFPPHGVIAMSSQSGALGLALLDVARDLGLGVSSFVSLGNKADVSSNDLIQYWEDDPETGVILLYLESFGNPRRFARLARRIGRKKPILAVKSGRSRAGSRAAESHTAALAADEVGVDALFHQAGIIRADTLAEMFDVAALLAGQALPAGPNVAVVTNAGGPAILAADALAASGLVLPEPGSETRDALAAALPAAASLGNPIDMIGSADAEDYRVTLEAVLRDASFDAVLVIFIPVGLAPPDEVVTAVRDAVRSARADGIRKPILACLMSSDPQGTNLALEGERIPVYRFPESAAHALAKVHTYAQWRRTPLGITPNHADLDLERARSICRSRQERGGGWLSADEVEGVLDAFGLPILKGVLVTTPDEATAAAEALGYPVVVKMASRTLVHKSEWDGVRVNLTGAESVRSALEEIEARLRAAGHIEALDGYLVQPMVAGGVELMVGMTHDPLFGPLLAFGLGGIYVEILRDVVFRITPLTDRDAEEMVHGIRGFELLNGYRGAPPADLEAIKDLVLRVSRLVEELPEIAELDLNPLKAHRPGEGCTILDARIRIEGRVGPPSPT